jgi:uncharacterized surface protein with fasciclin (FAS1) repeats
MRRAYLAELETWLWGQELFSITNEMHMKTLNYKLVIFSAFVALTTACTDDFKSPATPTGQTIAQVATANDSFDILVAAATKTGLAASLNNNNAGEFTVFAPTDDAFVTYFRSLSAAYAAYSESDVLALIETLAPSNTIPTLGTLTGVLNYHIKISKVESTDISGGQVFVMQNGSRLSLSKVGSDFLLNANTGSAGSQITLADVKASNGIIHAINKVMISPTTASIGVTLGFSVSYSTNPPGVSGGATAGNNYDVLSAAIRKTGLAPALLPNVTPLPDFTVFAPTDAAFVTFLGVADEAAALTLINGLTASTNPSLSDVTNILKYHVVSGRILSTDLAASQSVTTLLTGKNFTIESLGPPVIIRDINTTSANATISSANILTNAGIVHGIGTVLNPN